MSQLYQVSFQVRYEDIIDVGKVLVCADNQDQAADVAAFYLELPKAQTVFDVIKCKPSFWQLDRHEIIKNKVGRSRNKIGDSLGRYVVAITAGILAASEAHALRRLAQGIIERVSTDRVIADKAIAELEISCTRKEQTPRISATEKQAIYKEHQFFGGGMARPR